MLYELQRPKPTPNDRKAGVWEIVRLSSPYIGWPHDTHMGRVTGYLDQENPYEILCLSPNPPKEGVGSVS